MLFLLLFFCCCCCWRDHLSTYTSSTKALVGSSDLKLELLPFFLLELDKYQSNGRFWPRLVSILKSRPFSSCIASFLWLTWGRRLTQLWIDHTKSVSTWGLWKKVSSIIWLPYLVLISQSADIHWLTPELVYQRYTGMECIHLSPKLKRISWCMGFQM